MKGKFLMLVAFSTPSFCFIFLLFRYSNKFGFQHENRNHSTWSSTSGLGATTPKAASVRKRSDFDTLMHYILHPQTTCKSSVVLGGAPFRKTKMIDGDKIICLKPARKVDDPCIVYSFGIAKDWSFEEAIQKKYGCQVFAFDPSVGDRNHTHSENIWFFKMGLSHNDKERVVRKNVWKMNTFGAIKRQLNHSEDQTIDVVKMDIEGSEFKVLENMLDTGMLKNVNHLCMEIHLMYMPDWKRVYRMLRRIEEEMELHLFSTRNNTIAGYANVPKEKHRKECLLFELAWFRY